LGHDPRVIQLLYDLPDAFTAAQCDAMLRLGEAGAMEPATVWSGTRDHVDSRLRQAQRCHWRRDVDTGWIFDLLDSIFAEAAARFEVAVDPVFEEIQLVRYGVGDHFQSWHSDAGADRHWQRQISLSVELSDPQDHEGDVLEIVPATVGTARTLPRGGARIFLSRAIHRVTPVTRGVRHALVAWTGLQDAGAGASPSSG